MKQITIVTLRLIIIFLLLVASLIALARHDTKVFLTLLLGALGAFIFLLFDLFIFTSIKNSWFGEGTSKAFSKDYYSSINSLNNILIATSGVIIGVLGNLSNSKILPIISFGIVILFGIINANLLTGAIQNQYTEEIIDPANTAITRKKNYEIVELHPLHTTLVGIFLNVQFVAFILGTISVAILSIT
jgi:hypothetical protein